MYLSEYQHAKLHATIAKGWVHDWLQENPITGNPVWEEYQVAINAKKRLVQKQHNAWQIPIPLDAYEIMYDMVNYISQDESSGFMKHIFDEITKAGATIPVQKMIRPYFFSGDNLTFCVILFNTNYDYIKDMLDLDNVDSENPWYTVTMVVRYPVLDLNIEKVMINLRYKYFMRYSPNKWKWNEWRDGKWHIPGDRPWQDPQEFQNKPDPDDPLDRVVERDSRGNVVYPLRLLFHLPPNMTYRALKSKRDNLSLDFYVNNLDSDPRVRYKLPNESEEVWDHIQLFRINAETMVSREGYKEHGRSFFKFRLDEIPPGALVYPFKEYLDEYPDLQDVWADIWERRWPNMEGWVRLEPQPEENPRARLPIQQELPAPPAATRAPLSRQITARRAARALSERRQNEKHLLHMKYDSLACL